MRIWSWGVLWRLCAFAFSLSPRHCLICMWAIRFGWLGCRWLDALICNLWFWRV
jgi:hypothetical protein